VKHSLVDHSAQLLCFFQYCKTFSRRSLMLEAAPLIALREADFSTLTK
jgi:hypothetical protein